MTTLTEKLTALEGQLNDDADVNHSDNVSILSKLEDIQTAIANVDADLLAFKLQMASQVVATDPYACCAPGSIVTPPTSGTAQPVNSNKCKRVQAFIHAMHELTGVIGAATDSGIFWTPSIIISGISEVITTLVTGGTVPLPSLPEASNIAAKAISYGVNNIGRGDSLQSQFDSISDAMVPVMYSATSPSAIQGQYASIVDTSGLPGDEKGLIDALGYSALFNYYFDPASTPDLSPYSGTGCTTGTPGCTSLYAITDAGGTTTPDIEIPSCDYVWVGVAGAPTHAAQVYFDGVLRDTITVISEGHNHYYTDIPTHIHVHRDSDVSVFVVIGYCFGTVPSDT